VADDRTEFLIAMAAKLTGGDASVATLGALGDRMLAAGASANDLERTVQHTSAALEESTAAMKGAGDAVSAGEQKYGQLEAAADRTAKAVERIGQLAETQRGKLASALDAGDGKTTARATEKLRALVERQGEAVVKANAAAAAMNVEAAALDALKGKAGTVAAQHAALTKGFGNVKAAAVAAAKAEAAAAGTGKVNEIAEAFGKLGGPAGAAGQQVFGLATGFAKLGKSIGTAGPYVAIAVAIVAIASAAVLATVAIAKWAVGLTDANRTQGLLAAGMARSVAGGAALEKEVAKVGAVVPLANDELFAMASHLANSGLRGDALSSALERAAVSAAKLKFGPDFQKALLSLDFQAKRLQANIAATFGGLKIEKLLGGVQTLVALFDSTTASGRALKFLFESLLQPIIDGVADAVPAVERLFLQAEILALKAYIALKPYRKEIALVGQTFAIGAAVIAGVLAVAVLSVLGAVVLLTVAFGALVYGLSLLIEMAVHVAGAIVDELTAEIQFLTQLGSQMMDGLVEGITGSATAVVKAITDVVGGAVDAAKHLLGIGSPSKVFAGIGDFTAQGFAEGVKGGSGRSQDALEAMVKPPEGKGGIAGVGGSQFGNVSISISIEGRGESDEGLASKIAAAVRDVFESDALTIGGGETA
jgi:hypothetical protein